MHDVAIFVVGNLSLIVLGILFMVIAMLVPEEESTVEFPADAAKTTAEEAGDAGTNDRRSKDASGEPVKQCALTQMLPICAKLHAEKVCIVVDTYSKSPSIRPAITLNGSKPATRILPSRRYIVKRAESDSEGPPRLTRENEPEEAWGSKFEKDGMNPMKDPLAIMGLGAIFFPFILLGVFIATGVIDVNK